MTVNTKQWTYDRAAALYALPFSTLIDKSHHVLKENFDETKIQLTTLLNIKSGGCPENCAYCPQSAHYKTDVARESLMDNQQVLHQARKAKANGATRFCLVAAWRGPPKKEFPKVLEMVKLIKQEELECCVSLGMLNAEQAQELKAAGADFYNHNLDSSREFYDKIITTRSYDDRLETLDHVQEAGMSVCCGGIIGMGESIEDRINLLIELTRLKKPPEVVTVNLLMPVEGTPLEEQAKVDPIEHVKFIALARIMLPTSSIRLSAGRNKMDDLYQATCFYAGADSVIAGDKYLTQTLHDISDDHRLLSSLNMQAAVKEEALSCS